MKCKFCGHEVPPGGIASIRKKATEWQCNSVTCLKWNSFEEVPHRPIMEVSLGEPPAITLKEDVLRLHILYLEKVDSLNKGERTAYEEYLTSLSRPQIINVEEG